MPESSSGSSLVYRAFLSKGYFDPETKAVSPAAFYKRKRNDLDGLSVGYTQEQSRAPFKITYGVAELEESAVKSLSLEIVKTAEDHANITGIPRHENLIEEDQVNGWQEQCHEQLVYNSFQADHFARELARIAKLVSEEIVRKPK